MARKHINERKHLNTVSDVLDALGGNSNVARALGETPQTVGNWRLRQRIPAEYFLQVMCLLAARGQTVNAKVFGIRAVA